MKTVSDGGDLFAALQHPGPPHSGWITGIGEVEAAEIEVPGAEGVQILQLPGRVSLVSLAGPFGGPFMATLARASDGGVEIAAGRLTRARAVSVTLLISSEAAPGLTGESSETAQRPGSDNAATSTSQAIAEGEQESDVLPQYKDQVEHPVFGLCDVMVVRGDRMKIRDVHGPTRVREIHLGVFKVLQPEEREGVRVFRLLKR